MRAHFENTAGYVLVNGWRDNYTVAGYYIEANYTFSYTCPNPVLANSLYLGEVEHLKQLEKGYAT